MPVAVVSILIAARLVSPSAVAVVAASASCRMVALTDLGSAAALALTPLVRKIVSAAVTATRYAALAY
jgi:hypothetical protein